MPGMAGNLPIPGAKPDLDTYLTQNPAILQYETAELEPEWKFPSTQMRHCASIISQRFTAHCTAQRCISLGNTLVYSTGLGSGLDVIVIE